jgi:hypothetical protein
MNLARSLKAEDVVEIEVNSRTVNVIKALGSGKALIVLVVIYVSSRYRFASSIFEIF